MSNDASRDQKASEFSEQERATLEQVTKALLKPRGGQARGLDELLNRWCEFVREVESGYRLNMYDFTNDLARRDAIEALIQETPGWLRPKLEGCVRMTDEAFEKACEKTERPTLSGFGSRWWY